MNDLSVADVFSVNASARMFGSSRDTYFSELMSQPGLDIAGHNPTYMHVAAQLPSGSTIIDIGANIGLTVISGARLVPAATVIAVEPSPLAYAALTRMIDENHLTNCTVENTCLGAGFGTVSFVENGTFLAGSYIGAHAREDVTVNVPIRTLDSLVMLRQLQRVDFVKIDVEGYELDVLQGALGTIDRFDPVFVAEFNAFALTANRNLSPRALLDFIIDRFGSFQVVRDGQTVTISAAGEVRDFIYANMVSYRCVEDIIFGRPL